MKKHWLFVSILILFISVIISCKQSYEPAVIKANKNFLVVDGVINMGTNAVTTVKLSRTRNVTDSITASPELGAQVSIIGKNGSSYSLHEQSNGVYLSDARTLNAADEYALQITVGNSQYESDYVVPKQTPPIDSIEWKYSGDGVTFFVNTHDPQNNTRYYRWDYVETWEHHSTDNADISENNGFIFYVDSTNQTYACWQDANSTDILLGTSVNLAQDVISHDSIATVPQNSIKIGVRYSMLLKQYALDETAYNYWQLLQKNTQQLGSLFDAQPTQLTGNVHCLTNPSEPVLGYVSASTVEEKRIFIRNSQVNGWKSLFPGEDCAEIIIDTDPNNVFAYNYSDPSYGPYTFISSPGVTFLKVAKRTCLDCRLAGGTNQKPAFWQ